jgi:hypothetical protein
MTTLLGPPRPYQVALLTDAQYDRLYLDWHEQVGAEVAEAVALATGVRQRRADTFAALQRDITAIPLTGPEPIEPGTPAEHALNAQASLREAEHAYARRDLHRAVGDLQEAALIAREVLTSLGWSPAAL